MAAPSVATKWERSRCCTCSDGTVAGYCGASPRLGDMQRIIGTEVEYGISSPSDPTANPILTSTQAVLAYAAAAGIQRAKRTRWDYEVESPLRDARGFDLSRSAARRRWWTPTRSVRPT